MFWQTFVGFFFFSVKTKSENRFLHCGSKKRIKLFATIFWLKILVKIPPKYSTPIITRVWSCQINVKESYNTNFYKFTYTTLMIHVMWRLLNTLRKYYIADAAFMIHVNMLTLNYTQAIQDGTWSSNVRQYQYSGFKVPRTPLNCMKEKKKRNRKKT